MEVIRCRNSNLGRLRHTLALGFVLFALTFLIACSDDGATEAPQPTATQPAATSTSAPATAVVEPTPTDAPPPAETATPSRPPVQVVSTSNIVGDWARVVGGDRVEVFSLLPPGGDPHHFTPTAQDVARVADADLVLSIGLGLEADWLADLLHNASAEDSMLALGEGVDPLEFATADLHDDHDDDHGEDEHMDEHDDQHEEMIVGRLLVADAEEAHLSVIDLSTDEVDSGIFNVAAPGATVYPSPTHRYGIVLARGPENSDDRIHVFDGGVFLVEHGDHHDLVQEPVSRHSLEIAEEWPVHYVNSHGWTAIFTDAHGHVILINEHDLTETQGDYEPIELEAGPQHGAAVVISDDHVILSVNNPACTQFIPSPGCLPLGVEVHTFDNEVVYDAANRACPSLHGESHNDHGVVFGCFGGVLSVHAHDGEYEHELIPYPAGTGEFGEFAIGQFFGHHDSENFFGPATLFPGGQCCEQGGIWLVDVEHGEMHEVFPEPISSGAFSSNGETFYILPADGVLRAYDAHDGELIESVQLVDPFEIVFGSPSPKMIAVGEWLYVADPNDGHVLGVHLEHMEVEEEWHLGGAPSSLAFVGITGEAEEHDEHDDHGEMGGHVDEHGHDHGALDPHFWFDPNRVKVAVDEIASQLSAIDPDSASTYSQNASAFKQQLDELHAWIQEQVSQVPDERRLLVTSHDSLSYFADLYGFEVVGLVIPSLGTHVEPSAEHIAGVVEVVREHNIPAVFGETTVSERLAQAIAAETGASLIQLYSGSLGAVGSGADTYLLMFRANVERIVGGLK